MSKTFHIKQEFSFFRYPTVEDGFSHNSGNPQYLEGSSPDFICLSKGCFACERALLQRNPENAGWKKKAQKAIMAYETQFPDGRHIGGSFSITSLNKLKPADSEKSTKPFYIYDEKLGRKRRHDPWFAKHKAVKSERNVPNNTSSKTCEGRKKRKSQELVDSLLLVDSPSGTYSPCDASPAYSCDSPMSQSPESPATTSRTELCINLMPHLSLSNQRQNASNAGGLFVDSSCNNLSTCRVNAGNENNHNANAELEALIGIKSEPVGNENAAPVLPNPVLPSIEDFGTWIEGLLSE